MSDTERVSSPLDAHHSWCGLHCDHPDKPHKGCGVCTCGITSGRTLSSEDECVQLLDCVNGQHGYACPAVEGRTPSWCCCLGMIGNTVYKCLARGLDLGHCGDEGEPCFQEQACRERVASMTTPASTPSPEGVTE